MISFRPMLAHRFLFGFNLFPNSSRVGSIAYLDGLNLYVLHVRYQPNKIGRSSGIQIQVPRPLGLAQKM